MIFQKREKIVVLGMMSKMPVAGIVWLTMQHVVGLERLGYEVYYVEAHARTPSMLMQSNTDDASALAAAFIRPCGALIWGTAGLFRLCMMTGAVMV